MRRMSRYHHLVWVLLLSWLETSSASWASRQAHTLTLPSHYDSSTDLLCHIFVECASSHDGIKKDTRSHVDSKLDCKVVESISGSSITYSSEVLRRIEVPADIRKTNTHALVQGQWFVMIRNGKTEWTSSSGPIYASHKSLSTLPVVSAKAVSAVSAVSAVAAGSGISTRSWTPSAPVDVRSTLVIRVTTSDSEPTLLASEMSAIIFNDTEPSLTTQYSWCTHGRILFQPTSHGVLDVTVDIKAEGTEADAVAQAAYSAVNSMLGVTLETEYDHVLFCLPPGTNGNWIAYASINYWRSVYNDKWCTYISGYMHEIGHNLGFYHSNENGMPYADATGYMGSGYGQTTWPQKCFNGQNNWLMGWYQDRSLDLPLLSPKIYRLASFVDYDKVNSNEVVLIRIDQAIYLQYNRAKGCNKDTQEGINNVTVVEYIPVVFPGTSLIANLDNSTGPFLTTVNGTNHTVVIDVCGFEAGDGSTSADVALVSVGVGFSLCYQYKKDLVTATPIAPVYLQSPSQSPIYFKPSPDINEDFPTITWDGDRTPRLHRRPQFPLNLTRIFGDKSAATSNQAVSFLGAFSLLIGFAFLELTL